MNHREPGKWLAAVQAAILLAMMAGALFVGFDWKSFRTPRAISAPGIVHRSAAAPKPSVPAPAPIKDDFTDAAESVKEITESLKQKQKAEKKKQQEESAREKREEEKRIADKKRKEEKRIADKKRKEAEDKKRREEEKRIAEEQQKQEAEEQRQTEIARQQREKEEIAREKREEEEKQTAEENRAREKAEEQRQAEIARQKREEEIARQRREQERQRADDIDAAIAEANAAEFDRISALRDIYSERIRVQIREAILKLSPPREIPDNATIRVEVILNSDGTLRLDPRILNSSGFDEYDELVLRALLLVPVFNLPTEEPELLEEFRELNLSICPDRSNRQICK